MFRSHLDGNGMGADPVNADAGSSSTPEMPLIPASPPVSPVTSLIIIAAIAAGVVILLNVITKKG